LIDATISATDSIICAGETTTLSVPQVGSSNTACAALPNNLQNGLVGYWPFCGNANDASGNGNTLNEYFVSYDSDRFGNSNASFFSNGIELGGGSSMTSNNPVFNIGQEEYTIGLWMKVANTSQVTRCLFNTIPHTGIGIAYNDNNAPGYVVYDIGPANAFWTNLYLHGPSNNYTPNDWHYVVVKKQGINYSQYIDGQLDHSYSNPAAANYNYDVNFRISGISPEYQIFHGNIDDVHIYNRALSAAEIVQHYNLTESDFSSVSYLWSTGATTPTINVSPTSTTTYTCTVTTNGVSCLSNYTITVNNSSASTNIVTAFDSFTWLDGNTYTASNNTATYTTTNAAGCDSVISLNLTITPSSPSLALQVFLDGYYTNNSNPAAMTAARYNNLVASGSTTPGAATDVDVITVELRSPYNLDVVAYSVSPILQTNGSAQCVFPAGALGGSYYLVVKHRAANPLWSANPVTLSSSSAFSFANNSSNSYSDGSITPINTLVPSLFGIWLGELNDDGYLDGLDYPWFENETYSSVYGGLYLLDGDFNGDSYVDASDYAVFDYNSTIGSYEQRPY
jgi:hypothetical protein